MPSREPAVTDARGRTSFAGHLRHASLGEVRVSPSFGGHLADTQASPPAWFMSGCHIILDGELHVHVMIMPVELGGDGGWGWKCTHR